MKPEKVTEILSDSERTIWRIAVQIESFSAILQRQASVEDGGYGDLLGLGFALEDMSQGLRTVTDQLARAVGQINKNSTE